MDDILLKVKGEDASLHLEGARLGRPGRGSDWPNKHGMGADLHPQRIEVALEYNLHLYDPTT